jgi:hypothetical protein
MKKGDDILVLWFDLDGHGRGKARCEVLRTLRERSRVTGKIFVAIRIRDPKGRLWWHAVWCQALKAPSYRAFALQWDSLG